MELRNNRGYSLIEMMIAVSIMLFVGSMLMRYFSKNHEGNMQLEAKNNSRQILNESLARVRKGLETRDSTAAIDVQPTSIRYHVPISSTANSNYTVTITTRCRPLPAGENLVVRPSAYNQRTRACLDKIQCANGVPYTEWTYTGHPTLTLSKEPRDEVFTRQINKAYGSPGYALCFHQTANSLSVEGVLINLEKNNSTRTADLATEMVTLPLIKRNSIELVP